MFKITFYGLIFLLFIQCSSQSYPHERSFNFEASDKKAVRLADKVMNAMGGYENWTSTRYIQWNFFGARTLLWDKWNGRVRIDSNKDSFSAIININDSSGQVKKDGKVVTQTDSLKKYVARAKSIWINDSYWLVMPFKLKDSGVTLTYLGLKENDKGVLSEVIELTFEHVGDTPDNKYHVFIDPKSFLVNQWTFYNDAKDTEPRFSTPWEQYLKHGEILLSGHRGKNYEITEINVSTVVDEKLFSTL